MRFENRVALIVDDNLVNIAVLKEMLKLENFKIEVAGSGNEAIQRLGEDPIIDIIFVDLMMPEMDGFETIKLIREKSKYQKTAVIAVTGMVGAEVEKKCIKSGFSGYLTKPIYYDDLMNIIEESIS
jgi:CheY-like chemotaxis protein